MKKIKTLFSALYRPKVILWIGIALIVLMCLFPPWVTTDTRKGVVVYASLFSKKIDYFSYDGFTTALIRLSHIDSVRLIIQCAIVGLITGALLYTLNDKKVEGGGK